MIRTFLFGRKVLLSLVQFRTSHGRGFRQHRFAQSRADRGPDEIGKGLFAADRFNAAQPVIGEGYEFLGQFRFGWRFFGHGRIPAAGPG